MTMSAHLSHHRVSDIRIEFLRQHREGKIYEGENYEILNASFVADTPTIFGELNRDYIEKELNWYLTGKLNVNAMEPPIPKIWNNISGKNGEINSNYGWCIYSRDNFRQYREAISKLQSDKSSRQALMIYTRPQIHGQFNREGMSDFICTNTVQLIIRNNHLYYIVSMRSNDAVFGYKNDKAWHDYVFEQAHKELLLTYPNIKKSLMYWNAASLHIYPRHFHLLDNYRHTRKRGV